MPCRNGDHVHNCTNFECNMMFKCPQFYCIPWSYVCDHKWDCPAGFDEDHVHNCKDRLCADMFKCRGTNTCIHLGNVCDGQTDCLFGDDEYYCSLQNVQCLSNCQCLLFSLRCSKGIFNPLNKMPFLVVWIEAVSFPGKLVCLEFQDVIVLTITDTNLAYLCELICEMNSVTKLDAGSNLITVIKSRCFQSTCELKFINLAENKISSLESETFHNLSDLLILNLTGNSLTLLESHIFFQITRIKVFSINSNELTCVEKDLFQETELQYLQTDYYPLHCVSSVQAAGTVKLPWYLSCSNLLLHVGVQISMYSVSFVLLIVNVASIILQRTSFVKGLEKTGAYGTTIASVNVADVTSAIPLFILWAADLHFQAPFILNEMQ